jgi:WD40 repeat protein
MDPIKQMHNNISTTALTLPDGKENEISYMHFLSNRRLVLATLLGTISVLDYDLQSGSFELLKTIDSRSIGAILMNIRVSVDEKYIFTAHGSQVSYSDNYVKFWDLDSLNCVNIIDGHAYPIQNLEQDFISKQLIYSSGPSAIVWDIDSNQVVVSFNKHKKSISCISISEINHRVYSTCKYKLFSWDMSNGEEVTSAKLPNTDKIGLSENGDLFAIYAEREDQSYLQLINNVDFHPLKSFYRDKPSKMRLCQGNDRHNYLLRFNSNWLEIVDLETLRPVINLLDFNRSPSCWAVFGSDLIAMNDSSDKKNTIHFYYQNWAEK